MCGGGASLGTLSSAAWGLAGAQGGLYFLEQWVLFSVFWTIHPLGPRQKCQTWGRSWPAGGGSPLGFSGIRVCRPGTGVSFMLCLRLGRASSASAACGGGLQLGVAGGWQGFVRPLFLHLTLASWSASL